MRVVIGGTLSITATETTPFGGKIMVMLRGACATCATLQLWAMSLPRLSQSPRDPDFVQNPYGFYDRARRTGPLFHWEDYDLPCAASYELVDGLLRDRRFGREEPAELARAKPAHLAPFYALEAHSMLEREPPDHTRLRQQVLREFTARKIATLAPDIAALAHQLCDELPNGEFDLLPSFAEPIPVITIARLLGVPDDMSAQLLAWSHALVAMYQARRDHRIETQAVTAATEFSTYISGLIAQRRTDPRDDLISGLANAPDKTRLSEAEIISTVILLLNAGHEATVHSIGNGVAALLTHAAPAGCFADEAATQRTIAEILRFDPPLHMFTRYAMEPCEIAGHHFARGDQVGLLLAAANRDPARFAEPNRFDPIRAPITNASLGAGIHFCVGAPLARLEMEIALPILFARRPDLSLAAAPVYADRYHFHGLKRLMLS